MPPEKTIRYFPDKLPIGVTADGRTHLFLYLVNRQAPVDFRAFLHRHVELLRALPAWEVRLLAPRHLVEDGAGLRSSGAAGIAAPLRLDAVDELSWYFSQQAERRAGWPPEDFARFRRAHRRFHAPRLTRLYRVWKKDGDRLLHATVSPVLEDEIARGSGQVTSGDAGPCLCPSLPPGWLGVTGMNPANGGGTKTSGAAFPLLVGLGEARCARGDAVARGSVAAKLLRVRQLLTRNRAAFFAARAACEKPVRMEMRQPGRERPPRLPPDSARRPCREGVAHAPAACLVRPDKRDRALVVDTTQCLVAQRDARSSRTAPRDGCPPLQLLPDRRVLCH